MHLSNVCANAALRRSPIQEGNDDQERNEEWAGRRRSEAPAPRSRPLEYPGGIDRTVRIFYRLSKHPLPAGPARPGCPLVRRRGPGMLHRSLFSLFLFFPFPRYGLGAFLSVSRPVISCTPVSRTGTACRRGPRFVAGSRSWYDSCKALNVRGCPQENNEGLRRQQDVGLPEEYSDCRGWFESVA